MKPNTTVEKKPPMKPSQVFLGESCREVRDRNRGLLSYQHDIWVFTQPHHKLHLILNKSFLFLSSELLNSSCVDKHATVTIIPFMHILTTVLIYITVEFDPINVRSELYISRFGGLQYCEPTEEPDTMWVCEASCPDILHTSHTSSC